jgi:long-chain acyl-CoA synthetase
VSIAVHAEKDPAAAAVIEAGTGRTLTRGELVGRARTWARRWRELGAQPGDTVAIMLPNSLELIVAGLATALAQVQWVPVNWHLRSDEVAHILSDSGATLLCAHRDLAEVAEAAAQGIPIDWSSEDPTESGPLEDEWVAPTWVFYTSGTTGQPKGVVHAHMSSAGVGAMQDMLVAMWGFRSDDVHLLAGPGYHAAPGAYAFTTLYAGGSVVVLPTWDAELAWRSIAEHEVTTTFMTPAHLIRLLEVDDRPEVPTFRLLIHGGAPCPVQVKKRFLAAVPHTEVSELYGASEGGATMIRRADWEAHPGSVGRPWPGTEIFVRDSDGHDLPAGQEGLVWIQPPPGRDFAYHRDEAKTRDAWQQGAFTVGDIGRLDEDGWLYLTDRASDMVLWGGVNIYPREIEDVLHRHDAVVDCAVFGIPHDRDGEQLVAVVEAPGATEDELRLWMADHLAAFKVPRRIRLVDTLPRDPNGKVLKRHLKAAEAAL